MKAKDSPLYKTLCEAVRKEDHAELLRMLQMIDWAHENRSGWCGLSADSLRTAFWWHASPQRNPYWSQLSRRLKLAGWECW